MKSGHSQEISEKEIVSFSTGRGVNVGICYKIKFTTKGLIARRVN